MPGNSRAKSVRRGLLRKARGHSHRDRKERVLEAFRSRLLTLGGAVPDPKSMEEVLRQADAALEDCFASVRSGTVIIDHGSIPRRSMSQDRADCAELDTAEVLRVTDILFQVASEAATELFRDEPDGVHAVALWLRALHESISVRVIGLIQGHDGGVRRPSQEMLAADRRRLARDVHDWIGSGISLVHRNLDLYEVYSERGSPEAQTRFTMARKALNDLMDDARRLVAELRTYRANGDIAEKLRMFARCALPETKFDVRINGDEALVPRHQREELFVIIRECIRNVDKHADASRASVVVEIMPETVSVVVEDNGVGFAVEDPPGPADPTGGHGLISMRERVEQLGGDIKIGSGPMEGTRVELTVPLPWAQRTAS
ncbi:sensor histidine kinase [Streptomonospora nanhaiensis]|uniref:Signal transduction histidine kinase n=1 Tax=Streptomonospora nanhaiensis TaxID=1323731 RepID=A0A853BL49_9ACTN|nr:ATP-binding protein [Streptomonospora nanhaiensis]MBX9391639.1 hypothetical protein [Streptomonospora nanhaiensis]NYI95286.1 signal transduction histidine kinase [Streptomonospora nanhaiensis]